MENAQTPPANPQILLSWSAPSAVEHNRSRRWYLLGGTFVIACAVYGILAGQWSFTVVMILLGGFYALNRRTPETHKSIAITQEGIIFKNEFTEWRDIKDFWMLQGGNYIELHLLRLNKKWNPEIVVQTGSTDARMIRAFLSQYISERSGQTERLLDTIIRLCKL